MNIWGVPPLAHGDRGLCGAAEKQACLGGQRFPLFFSFFCCFSWCLWWPLITFITPHSLTHSLTRRHPPPSSQTSSSSPFTIPSRLSLHCVVSQVIMGEIIMVSSLRDSGGVSFYDLTTGSPFSHALKNCMCETGGESSQIPLLLTGVWQYYIVYALYKCEYFAYVL